MNTRRVTASVLLGVAIFTAGTITAPAASAASNPCRFTTPVPNPIPTNKYAIAVPPKALKAKILKCVSWAKSHNKAIVIYYNPVNFSDPNEYTDEREWAEMIGGWMDARKVTVYVNASPDAKHHTVKVQPEAVPTGGEWG